MRYKKKNLAVIIGIIAALIISVLFFCNNTRLGYMMTINLHGYTEIETNLYLDNDYSGDYQEIQELLKEALERVSNFWGTLESKPVIILSENKNKLNHLGYSGSPFTSSYVFHGAMTYTIFSTSQLDVDILAHEITHAELYCRVYKDKWYNSSLIPVWFNEGVAMQNDYRETYNEDAWKEVTSDGTNVKSLSSIASFQNFYTDNSKVNYIIARHDLHDWINKNGIDALIDLIQTVNEGEDFDELYPVNVGMQGTKTEGVSGTFTYDISSKTILDYQDSKASAEIDVETDSVKQEEPIIWYADITQDGIDEKIVVDLTYVINYPKTGEEQTVSVYSGSSGELLWTGHADTVHPGWNGIYIYNDGKKDYMLLWQPTVYQDSAEFHFRIFSLTEDGKEIEILSKNIQFAIYHPKDGDTDTISEFVDMVNGYLEKSFVLVDTDNGTPVYSTANNKIVNFYDVSWILEEIKETE